jgi:hypothetical protein
MRFFDSGVAAAVMIAASLGPAGGIKGVDGRFGSGHDHADRFAS